jgi:hypothetical protein
MTIDFQQVREQVKQLGKIAKVRAEQLQNLQNLAAELHENYSRDSQRLQERIERISRTFDVNLRCAAPATALSRPAEALNFRSVLPDLKIQATLLAADGSQINPDRQAAVNFSLINVGAIQLRSDLPAAPQVTIVSKLLYDEDLYTPEGVLSEAQVALMRDLYERKRLAELAKMAEPPVITFTDGPMELWGAKDGGGSAAFEHNLDSYKKALSELHALGTITAGYVDKPAANLVVRLLEIGMLEEGELAEVKDWRPLGRVSDRSLFQRLLRPGERSAVFAIQSRSAQQYQAELALYFFYLNVGRSEKPWLARVEIPAWVAEDLFMLDSLHSVLYQQCQIMGSRPYPYLIHRAHEVALVSMQEKDQVTQMIINELTNLGMAADDISAKQFAKDLAPRTRLGKGRSR